MFKAKIFLVGKDEEDLTPMEETAYETEDVLQIALERYPDLLPGDQINPEAPRRWLLVAREMGIPGEIDAADRWSLDHLFLDQDGRPTFVECKRASDTRSRREVIAQMLDYAANGTAYWGADRLRQSAAETAKTRGNLLDDEIRRLVKDPQVDIEAFWQTVDENLKQGNVRLIFVADDIPQELRRLVDFLGRKMVDVKVLAVEIKQFKGKNQRALVPRVIGRTEGDSDGKVAPKLTRPSFSNSVPRRLGRLSKWCLTEAWNEAIRSIGEKLPFRSGPTYRRAKARSLLRTAGRAVSSRSTWGFYRFRQRRTRHCANS